MTGTWRAEGSVESLDGRSQSRRPSTDRTGEFVTSRSRRIYDGKVEGNTVAFKCQSPGGDRIVTLKGSIVGDDMILRGKNGCRLWRHGTSRDATLDPGDANAAGMFGASSPHNRSQ